MEIILADIEVYSNGEIELNVSVGNNTIWLSQIQLSELFKTSTDNVSLHLKNIYKEKELVENSTVEYFSVVRKEGNRDVIRNIKHYNLDATISLGYRVNSAKATKFRQWATSVLKEYIANGYAVNREKITQQRLLNLESDVDFIKSQIKNDVLEFKEQVFFNGSYFDAHSFIIDLIKSAKNTITLIDNYIDNTTLAMLSNNQDVNITLISHTFSKQLQQDIEKYNKQYNTLRTIANKTYHNRYLIIDKNRVYDIGSSLKDSGHKTSSVVLMSDFCEDDILKRLESDNEEY